MKRKLLAFAIVVFIFGKGFGQERGNVEYGFGVGYSTSTVTENNTSSNGTYRHAMNIAVSADYYFSDRWSLKGKLIYDLKGWRNNDIFYAGYNDPYNSSDYNLNYFTVPIMANWHFGRTRNWYLNFGPYIGFLAQAKALPNQDNIKSAFNSIDGGFAFDIGVKIPLSNQIKFFVELEGTGGAANIVKTTDGSSINNSRGSLNIGFNFL